MKADLYRRLFKAIYTEDFASIKKIASLIIDSERKLGHHKLADSLEKMAINENKMLDKPLERPLERPKARFYGQEFATLPTSKRNNMPLVTCISRENLKHHMVLPEQIEQELLRIEQEYVAKERLRKYNLYPKRKILLYGASGCGKTLSAERIAWNLGLPLLKVRFDTLISSFLGESAANLRNVFEYCKSEPVVLLLDECDFIAKSRVGNQDVGEVPRIVNMLLTLLDEYDAPGLVIATTNLKLSLDEALFRRFDEIIEIPMPTLVEIERLFKMTLSAMPVSPDINYSELAVEFNNNSSANIVAIAQNAAKNSILDGSKCITKKHFYRLSI